MLLGAAVSLVVLVLVLLLPVLTFVQSVRLRSQLNAMNARLDWLERQLAGHRPSPPGGVATEPAVHRPAGAAASMPQPPPLPERAAPSREPERDLVRDLAARVEDGDLEGRIGGRWLQHAGMVVLVLGVAFFLRYAFDRAWLSPAIRVALGVLAGAGMSAGGLRLSRSYRGYGLFLSGGGLAVLYLSVYAGLNLYYLVGPQLAFGVLVMVTIAAAALADRADSLGLALMAVCGGFATPFLVGGSSDQQLTPFTYVALLVGATMYLAHRRGWAWLNAASLLLTGVTVLLWAGEFYTPDKYLRTELFLTLYCAMFVEILRTAWRSADGNRPVVTLLLLAPVGYHAASLVLLAPHGLAFLVYVIEFTTLAVIAGVHYGSSRLRLIAWLAAALPLAYWIGANQWQGWLTATLAAIAAIYAVHLAAQIRAVVHGSELDGSDVALLHVNGVGVFAALFEALVDSAPVARLALLAVVLAAGNAGVWAALRRMAPVAALHWLGVAITLTAIAIWIHLGGPWAAATWATEGVVVFWIALRSERQWMRIGAWTLFGMALYRWLRSDIQETTIAQAVIANPRALTGLFLVGLLYVAAWLQHRQKDAGDTPRSYERAVLIVGASIVTLIVVSTEIVSFWTLRTASADARVAREMMLSTSWAIYAAVLIAVGIKRRYAPIRYFAIAVMGVTLAKVFLIDLATLGGIYRVAGFLAVGLILLVVSFLYQRRDGARAKTPSTMP